MTFLTIAFLAGIRSLYASGTLPPDLAEVAYGDVASAFEAEATIEAVRQSTLAAQVNGRIVELAVKAGDTVRAGQVIARVDPRTANEAVAAGRSQIAQAEAQLANARRRHERNVALLAQKFVSQAAVDQSQADMDAARAQLDAAKAGAASAIAEQSFTTLVAPYAGVIGATHADLGDMASPGKPIATLFDPAALRAVATLPQAALARWQRSTPSSVEVPAVALRLSVAPTSTSIVPLADPRSHTVRVRLDLPSVPGLLPGQFARVAFPVGTARALSIPGVAVLRRGELSAVYVVDADGRPALRQVRLGEALADGRIEVLAGLSPGERVSRNPVAAGIVASGARR